MVKVLPAAPESFTAPENLRAPFFFVVSTFEPSGDFSWSVGTGPAATTVKLLLGAQKAQPKDRSFAVASSPNEDNLFL